MAGLRAEFENGLMAIELDSAVISDLAIGAFGRMGRAVEPLEVSEATALATTGESVAGDLGCSVVGNQRRRSAAESIKDHLSVAGRGEDAVACDTGRIAVPRYRCHWPIGHVLNSTLERPRALLEELLPSPLFFESDRFCRGIKLFVLYQF